MRKLKVDFYKCQKENCGFQSTLYTEAIIHCNPTIIDGKLVKHRVKNMRTDTFVN